MTRTFLLAGLLLSLATSVVQAQPRGQNPNLTDEITKLEKGMWDLWKAHKFDEMKAHMAADAVFLGANGIFDRDGMMASLRDEQCEPTSIGVTAVKVSALSPDIALITYRVAVAGTCGGTPLPPVPDFVSSLWVKRGARWLVAHHHQTPASK